jgi:hypothetical protein
MMPVIKVKSQRFVLNKEQLRQLNYRTDGRIDWLCPEHGVGHTVYVPEPYEKIKAYWDHGCCGCCKELKLRANVKEWKP